MTTDTARRLNLGLGLLTGCVLALLSLALRTAWSPNTESFSETIWTNEAKSFDTEAFLAELHQKADEIGIKSSELHCVVYKGDFSVGYTLFAQTSLEKQNTLSHHAHAALLQTPAGAKETPKWKTELLLSQANGKIHGAYGYVMPDGKFVETADNEPPRDIRIGTATKDARR